MAEANPNAQSPMFQLRGQARGLAAQYLIWRIAERVEVVPSGCWECRGTSNGKGYAHIDLKNWDWPERVVQIHRLVYELCVDRIPDGLNVLHRCDNPPCVNPAHLFLGTNQDNVDDKMAKDRHRCPSGENHEMSKLTAEGVMTIRKRRAAGESCVSIARDFGLSDSHVSAIVKGKVWAHLPLVNLCS